MADANRRLIEELPLTQIVTRFRDCAGLNKAPPIWCMGAHFSFSRRWAALAEFVGEQRDVTLLEPSSSDRRLTDAMAGDGEPFAREDATIAACAVVDPVLVEHRPVIAYATQSWGPPEAKHFIAADGGWHSLEPAS